MIHDEHTDRDPFDDHRPLDTDGTPWHAPAPLTHKTLAVLDDILRPAPITVRWWAAGRALVLEHDTAGDITLSAPDARDLAHRVLTELADVRSSDEARTMPTDRSAPRRNTETTTEGDTHDDHPM